MRIVQRIAGCMLVSIQAVTIQSHLGIAADESEGRVLAEQHCMRCHHATDEGAVAPPLSSFKEKWPVSYLEEALAEGIVTGHDNNMPALAFSADEIEDLLAYINSL